MGPSEASAYSEHSIEQGVADHIHTMLSYPRDFEFHKSYVRVSTNAIKYNYQIGKGTETVSHRNCVYNIVIIIIIIDAVASA
jgi:hypothetical protein